MGGDCGNQGNWCEGADCDLGWRVEGEGGDEGRKRSEEGC